MAAVRRVQRQVLAVQRALRQNGDHLPHLLHGPRHVAQVRRAQREVVAGRRVGRVPRDQILELLDAVLVVSRDHVEEPARSVSLALGHPVQVRYRLLDVLLGILLPVEIARRDRQPRVAEAELRIEGDGFCKALQRQLELAARQGLGRRRVLPHDLDRCCRQRLHREAPVGVGRVIAERLAHVRRKARRDREHLRLVRRGVPNGRNHVAGHRVNRSRGDHVPAALPLQRPRHHHAEPLLERDLLRRALVERIRRADAEAAADRRPVEGRDESGVLERDLQHRLQSLIERWIARAVLEVRNHHGDRLVHHRRRGRPGQPPRARRNGQGDQNKSGDKDPVDRSRFGDRL